MHPRPRRAAAGAVAVLLAVVGVLAFLSAAALFLKELSSQIAVSDARDIVTVQINKTIARLMGERDYGGDYFVQFEKNDRGVIEFAE